MKRLITLSILLIIAFSFISSTTKRNSGNDKFIYIIARPNAAVNQSTNCFFSTVIQYKADGNCSKETPSANNYFIKAGNLFFADIAKKYNLVIEDWILKFVGDGIRKEFAPDQQGYFDSKAKAENARTADIIKLSNKTGGKFELIETPYTYNCD